MTEDEKDDLKVLLDGPLPSVFSERLVGYLQACGALILCAGLFFGLLWIHWVAALVASPILLVLGLGPFGLVEQRVSQLRRLRSLQRIEP